MRSTILSCAVFAGLLGVACADDSGSDLLSAPFPTGTVADAGPVYAADAGDAFVASGLALAIPCADDAPAIYTRPGDLPAFATGVRGDVVRCVPREDATSSQLQARLSGLGFDAPVLYGARILTIGYRTQRSDGSEAYATAVVHLPDPPPSDAIPLVVVAHDARGIADSCAPSRTPGSLDEFVLPLVGQGLAVVTPDYAGLGTAGVRGVGDGLDTGRSIADAATAVERMLRRDSLTGQLIGVGYGQGGGGVLALQGLSRELDGLELTAVVALAPSWKASPELDEPAFASPATTSSSRGGGFLAAEELLLLYADAANALGSSQEGDWFHADLREELLALLEGSCVLDLAADLPKLAPTMDRLLDPAFVAGLGACAAGGCDAEYDSFLDRHARRHVAIDAAGAPILLVQGGNDTQAPAARTACYEAAIVAAGVGPAVCFDEDATHFDLAKRQMTFVQQWVAAVLAGKSQPSCPSTSLPTCTTL